MHNTPNTNPDDPRFGSLILRGEEAWAQPLSVALVGVPQDIGVSRNGGRPGAAHAPDHIRKYLSRLTLPAELLALQSPFTIGDCGDIRCEASALEEIHERQQQTVEQLLKTGAFVIVMGGGHDIAYADGCALASVAETIGIINVDAHPDVRSFKEVEGVMMRHSGSPFRQLLEDPAVRIAAGAFIEFGIQPLVSAASHRAYVEGFGHRIVLLDQARSPSVSIAFAEALRSASAASAIYCSLDLDAVASAYAPGVSAPASDGFSAADIITIASLIGANTQCQLADVVELNPAYDVDDRTSRLAATIIARMIVARLTAS